MNIHIFQLRCWCGAFRWCQHRILRLLLWIWSRSSFQSIQLAFERFEGWFEIHFLLTPHIPFILRQQMRIAQMSLGLSPISTDPFIAPMIIRTSVEPSRIGWFARVTKKCRAWRSSSLRRGWISDSGAMNIPMNDFIQLQIERFIKMAKIRTKMPLHQLTSSPVLRDATHPRHPSVHQIRQVQVGKYFQELAVQMCHCTKIN